MIKTAMQIDCTAVSDNKPSSVNLKRTHGHKLLVSLWLRSTCVGILYASEDVQYPLCQRHLLQDFRPGLLDILEYHSSSSRNFHRLDIRC